MAIDPTSAAVSLAAATAFSGSTLLATIDPTAIGVLITVVGSGFVGIMAYAGREWIKYQKESLTLQAGTVQEKLRVTEQQLTWMTDRYGREEKIRTRVEAENDKFRDENDRLRDQNTKDFHESHQKIIYLTDFICSRFGITIEPSDHIGPAAIAHVKSERVDNSQ